MADPVPAAPVVAPAAPVAPAPAPAAPAPVANVVADAAVPAAIPAPAAPAAPAAPLAVAPVDPVEARAYLAQHGMTAEDAAKIPDAELAAKYEAAKTAEAAKPIEYKDFTLPKDVVLDPKLLSEIKVDFANAKLTQEQAQGLVDKHVAAVKASVESNVAAFNQMQTEWRNEVMADPQIGGANFESKTVPAIAKAIDTFCPDEASRKAYRDAMTLTGMGNNPAHVRFMARLGASLMEGQPASGAPPVKGPKTFDSIASNIYPNQGQSK